MSLKRKIALSFFASALIIAILVAFEYLNFLEIRKEIRYLEVTDTIRSKSLQLRRHEKNFFLYGYPTGYEEIEAIERYLNELDDIVRTNLESGRFDNLGRLGALVSDYRKQFSRVEKTLWSLTNTLNDTPAVSQEFRKFLPLIELTFPERPADAAGFMMKTLSLPPDHKLIRGLMGLSADISALRKTGENLIRLSKELDRMARQRAERVIRISQVAIIIFFPLFFVTGIGMLFFSSRNIVRRLRLLIDVVEKTGKGDFSRIKVPPGQWGNDEVGILIKKMNEMEEQLADREEELQHKNSELLQSKKLAAIGTLASGVAHELNNPLSNIYLSAQVLARETKKEYPDIVAETVRDILSQTIRVKGIVSDLLEFARGREPQFKKASLKRLVTNAYELLGRARDVGGIEFTIDSEDEEILIYVDVEMMERVFINLFNNAIDAIAGEGAISVRMRTRDDGDVEVVVADTGRGIEPAMLEKIFDPFFTTKNKGAGLGLAIVFNIIKKHGGAINVSSEPGRGTTFSIMLPMRGAA